MLITKTWTQKVSWASKSKVYIFRKIYFGWNYYRCETVSLCEDKPDIAALEEEDSREEENSSDASFKSALEKVE